MAYTKDPRIAIYKEEDKQKKNEIKEMRKLEREKKEKERREIEIAEERALKDERLAQEIDSKQANIVIFKK